MSLDSCSRNKHHEVLINSELVLVPFLTLDLLVNSVILQTMVDFLEWL